MIASITPSSTALRRLFARLVALGRVHRATRDYPALMQEIEKLGYRQPTCGTVAGVEREFLEAVAAISVRPDYGLTRMQAFSVCDAYAAQFTSVLRSTTSSTERRDIRIPDQYQRRLLELGKRHAQAVCELCSDFGAAPETIRSRA